MLNVLHNVETTFNVTIKVILINHIHWVIYKEVIYNDFHLVHNNKGFFHNMLHFCDERNLL
jgi:hypothetical protein